MNWVLAAAAPAVTVSLLALTGRIHPAMLAYHALCAIAIFVRRQQVRSLLTADRRTALWAIGTTLAIVVALPVAPFIVDLASFRGLFRQTLFPRGDPSTLFWAFAAYTLIVHVPLEEIFWRGAVGTSIAGNAAFFYLNHAVPMTIVLESRGMLYAAPTAAAGAVWAFVTLRSRSLWPALVSHWGADAAILGGMWFFFIR